MDKKKKKDEEENSHPKIYGNPDYEASEDIYSKAEKATSIDADDNPKLEQKSKTKLKQNNLDVPGAELDDENEINGEEDEENNYYSLGGDDHNDLEEDNEQ